MIGDTALYSRYSGYVMVFRNCPNVKTAGQLRAVICAAGEIMANDPTKARGALGKSIASKIKAARVECGMSQEALGKYLGVTFQQIQKYEKGVNRITPDRLQLIAEKVGRPITYFFELAPAQTAPAD